MVAVTELINTIKGGEISPIYFLTGKEKFFHDQIISLLSQQLFSDPSSRSLNRIVLHGSESSFPEIVSASLSYPMLSDKKLVIVKNFSKLKTSNNEPFLKYLEQPQPSTILILSSEETGNNKVVTTLKKKAVMVDCKPIPDYKMADWLMRYVKLQKITIEPAAVGMLADYAGSNILTIEQELRKVQDYKNDNSTISEEDIMAVTGMSKDYNVFTLQKALSQKNLAQSFKIGKNLIDTGQNINLILSVIFGFFKKAMIVARYTQSGKSVQNVGKELKINSFQMRDIQATVQKFNYENLTKIINHIHELDRQVKTSAQSDWSALQSLCFNICRL